MAKPHCGQLAPPLAGGGAGRAGWLAAAASDAPQLSQKVVPAGAAVPQPGQTSPLAVLATVEGGEVGAGAGVGSGPVLGIGAPQFSQKASPGRVGWPHCPQAFAVPGMPIAGPLAMFDLVGVPKATNAVPQLSQNAASSSLWLLHWGQIFIEVTSILWVYLSIIGWCPNSVWTPSCVPKLSFRTRKIL
ncbi:MAG: hypothetical protein Kow0031_25660 [Anaerolineae bacterium]